MTHEQFIELKTAKLAKQAGFDWECEYRYIDEPDYKKPQFVPKPLGNGSSYTYPAPTQAVLQRWLREEKSLHITIFSSSQESWMFRITKRHQNLEDGIYGEDFHTYETALEAGLQQCLTLIENNE